MFGPKLEPRSYTTFLLVVVAVLLTLNLFAQRRDVSLDGPVNVGRTLSADVSEPEALREIARSITTVAQSNQAIADSIRQLSGAVAALKLNVTVPAAGSSGEAEPVRPPDNVILLPPSAGAQPAEGGEGTEPLAPEETPALEPGEVEDTGQPGTFTIR